MSPITQAAMLVAAAVAVTGTIALSLEPSAGTSQAVPYSFWLELAKTAIGAFLGAGLAFASTLLIQWRLRVDEHVKAGNLTLALLVQQLNDFLSIKATFLRQRKNALASRSGCPLWLQFLPSQYDFTESVIDTSSMAFLFDQHGTHSMQLVLRVQYLHRALRSLVNEHRDVRIEIQQRQAGQGIKPFDTMPLKEIEDRIGPYLIARAISAAETLLKRFDEDEQAYESAFTGLRTELRRRFGRRFIDMGTAQLDPPPPT